jgi:hypothetical protein
LRRVDVSWKNSGTDGLSGLETLTEASGATDVWFPVWSPDVSDSESGRAREILFISAYMLCHLTVAADNRSIYFARYIFEADIWMLTLEDERE